MFFRISSNRNHKIFSFDRSFLSVIIIYLKFFHVQGTLKSLIFFLIKQYFLLWKCQCSYPFSCQITSCLTPDVAIINETFKYLYVNFCMNTGCHVYLCKKLTPFIPSYCAIFSSY